MVIQSRPMRLLMTRPLAQSLRFARDLRKAMDRPLRITHAPLITLVFLRPIMPPGDFAAIIFTSETGVDAARHLGDLPRHAFCVGDQTARAARKAGFATTSASGDAETLLLCIVHEKPKGRLLHICGADTRGDIAKRLSSAGIETLSLISYRQNAADLTDAARRVLAGKMPVIVPLFSPRTAQIFAAQVEPTIFAPVYVAAFSLAVADTLLGLRVTHVETATRPTADAMIAAIRRIADNFPVT